MAPCLGVAIHEVHLARKTLIEPARRESKPSARVAGAMPASSKPSSSACCFDACRQGIHAFMITLPTRRNEVRGDD